IMIGFGRAVVETMIVLMATGNTPVMYFSIFQGMRTLSANIAVEMPESEVGSTHYRVLFLAALVLFLFTFLFNTVGEIVRQRLRRKYGSL
ncbi:MAG: phosphate ABC transporter permease, partial [Gammaproteobacteria bacterium]